MNAQKIADRLDGMTHGSFKVSPAGCLARGWVCLAYGSDWLSAPPEEFLALCRAVVERVHGTTFTGAELPDMTFDDAEKLWPETDYAFEAANQDKNPINSGDATAFFLEGYLFATNRIKDGIAAVAKRNQEAK